MRAHQTLEHEWAEFNELAAESMVACSSGTAALHLAMEALRTPKWKAVAVPDFTMVACARAVSMAGLLPLFVDCGHDLLMSPDDLDRAASSVYSLPPDCIMAVHVYGRQCDMGALITLAAKYGAAVVEDLAEAHGIRPHANTDAACWSFYQNKVVAGEEGGAVWFRNPKHAALARQLRNLGFTEDHDFNHIPRGWNYRLADCLADKVLGSLRVYEPHLNCRKMIEEWYDSACPVEWRMPPRVIPWVYDFRLPITRGDVQESVVRDLRHAGYQARHGFKRMTCLQEYRYPGRGFTNAAAASQHIVYLPIDIHSEMCLRSRCQHAFEIAVNAVCVNA